MDEFLIRAILASLSISFCASAAGTLTIFRRASFLVAGAAHSALAGAAIAIFLNAMGINVPYFTLALVFAAFSAILASYSARKGDINTGIAISFALSMSLAVIVLSFTPNYASKAWQLLFGDLLLLTETDIVVLVVSTVVFLIIVAFLFNKFIFVSFDPEGAEASGIDVPKIDTLMIVLISLSVVSALKAVGAILVFAIFVAPAATAGKISKNVAGVFYLSFLISFLCLCTGIYASYAYALPAGAFAALVASILYFIVALR